MKRLIKFMVVAGLVLALATGANAVTLNIIGGDPGIIPTNQTDEFLSSTSLFGTPAPGNTLAGYFDSAIQLVGGPAAITVAYYGAEAGYTNAFAYGGTTLFTHAGSGAFEYLSPPTVVSVGVVSAGVLDFSFIYNGGAGSVTNLGNPANTVGVANFFASVDGAPTDSSGSSIWLFLDDGAGSAENHLDNHDDLLVRITARSVPEPATLLLLGLGLVGLAGLRRMR